MECRNLKSKENLEDTVRTMTFQNYRITKLHDFGRHLLRYLCVPVFDYNHHKEGFILMFNRNSLFQLVPIALLDTTEKGLPPSSFSLIRYFVPWIRSTWSFSSLGWIGQAKLSRLLLISVCQILQPRNYWWTYSSMSINVSSMSQYKT